MRAIYLLLLILVGPTLLAQPEICPDEPAMTTFCVDACIICDIDGFQGRHESAVPGSLPEDFCTFVVHNSQWIAFIAGSEDLSVDISVSNCQNGPGLEIAIYASDDCFNFTKISNCYGGVTGPVNDGQTKTVTVNQPLTIGQYYYLTMDGVGGANCDWTLNVTNGSTQVLPLAASGTIIGPDATCPGVVGEYVVDAPVGATEFAWTLNGQPLGESEPTLEVPWTTEGSYQLCVTASNACNQAPPVCRTILVESIPLQTLEPIICEGDSFMLNDSTVLDEAGSYEFNYTTAAGCDSTVFVNLSVSTGSLSAFAFNICEGDTITLAGTDYFEEGNYEQLTENYLGCDSLIVLDLGVIVCEIQGTAAGRSVVCNGDSNGGIDFSISDGTPPFDYTYQNLGNTVNGSGSLGGLNVSESIDDLPVGVYLVTVSDNFGNDVILIAEVTEPPVLIAEILPRDYNGVNISCNGAMDGWLEATVAGGQAPYITVWSNGQTAPLISNLAAGNYNLSVTDALGCETATAIELSEPEPLLFLPDYQNGNCEGEATGVIEFGDVFGGTAPYEYLFENDSTLSAPRIDGLPAGTYRIGVSDANGCSYFEEGTLVAPLIPVVDLPDEVEISLADSIRLPLAEDAGYQFAWDTVGAPGLSCYDCPTPFAAPLRSTVYQLTVTSPDGCTDTDEILVRVVPRRRVFVPDAISPNDDGINDRLVVSAGPEVAEILDFQLFDRWGGLLYEQSRVIPDQKLWDGRVDGRPMDTGVYVWTARVRYIDGVEEMIGGSLAVLR